MDFLSILYYIAEANGIFLSFAQFLKMKTLQCYLTRDWMTCNISLQKSRRSVVAMNLILQMQVCSIPL